MASNRSIGTLTAYINANSTGLLREFNKVDRQLARWSSSWTRPGAKLALGFLGVQNALSAVSSEVRHVIANVERIPGVPAATQASIVELRGNLTQAKNWIDRMTAGMVAFGAQAAQSVGVAFAGFGGHDDTSGLSQLGTPDEQARAADSGFDVKLEAARKRLRAAQDAGAFAGLDEVEQIRSLRAEAARLQKFSESSSINSLQKMEAQTEAAEKLKQATAAMAALNKQLAESEKDVSEAMTGAYVATLSRTEAIAGLEARTSRVQNDLAGTSNDPSDPAAVARRTALNRELAETQRTLGRLYEEQAKLGSQAGEMIASSFEEAIFAGGKLGETLKALATDLARMVFQDTVTAPLAKTISGGIKALFGGARAAGGPVSSGTSYLVGERGPELFVPAMSGAIVPNHRLRQSGGGSSSQFIIDARGADRSGLAALADAIRQLDGSIEQRSVAAVFDRVKRMGGATRAFA